MSVYTIYYNYLYKNIFLRWYSTYSLFVFRSSNFPLYKTELAFKVLLIAWDKFSLLDEVGEWGEWSSDDEEDDDEESDEDLAETCCCWFALLAMVGKCECVVDELWVISGDCAEMTVGLGGLLEFLLLIELGGLGVAFELGSGGCCCSCCCCT